MLNRMHWIVLAVAIGLVACTPLPDATPSADITMSANPIATSSIGETPETAIPQTTATPQPDQTSVVPGLAASAPAPRIGETAPDFQLPGVDGETVQLRSFRGNVVVLNFWATWCVPCRTEMPALDTLYRTESIQDLVVLGVNVGEDLPTVREFLAVNSVSFPIAIDQDMAISLRYKTISLPTSYIIDPNGIVRSQVFGAMTLDRMHAEVEKARDAAGQPQPTPVSIASLDAEMADTIVGEVEDRRITLAEVDRRLDLLLAFERLQTGAVLDITSPSGQADLEQRRKQVLRDLIDEELLNRAAIRDGVVPPEPATVDAEIERIIATFGGEEQLEKELAAHGVTIGDLRETVRRGMLAEEFIHEHVLTENVVESEEEAVRRWLSSEWQRVTPTMQLVTGS